jgi:hypothetical protein
VNAWDLADETLKRLQNGFVSANSSQTYTVYLYKNNYTPAPGASLGDFVMCDFPGFVPKTFPISSFGLSSVTSHIATLTSSQTLIFDAAPTGTFSQDVYGYAVFDELLNYAWCESFATPYTVIAGSRVEITPRLKQSSCAAP